MHHHQMLELEITSKIILIISLTSISYLLFKLATLFVLKVVSTLTFISKPLFSRLDSKKDQKLTSPSPSKPDSKQQQQQNSISLKSLIRSSKKQASSSADLHHDSSLFLATLKGGSDITTGLAFSIDGTHLATSSEDRIVRVYDLSRDDIERNKPPPFKQYEFRKQLIDVAFADSSPHHLAVLTSGLAGVAGLSLLDLSRNHKQSQQRTIAADEVLVTEAATPLFSSPNISGMSLKSSRPGSINTTTTSSNYLQFNRLPILVAVSQKPELAMYSAGRSSSFSSELVPLGSIDTGGIINYGAVISTDGRFIAAATFVADVKIYEALYDRSGFVTGIKKVMDLKGHKKKITSVEFSWDSTRAVSASEDGTLRIWNIDVRYALQEDPKPLVIVGLPSGKQPVTKLAWSIGGHHIAAVSGSTIFFLDAKNGEVVDAVQGAHKNDIVDIAWRSQGMLATAGKDGKVRLWRAPQ